MGGLSIGARGRAWWGSIAVAGFLTACAAPPVDPVAVVATGTVPGGIALQPLTPRLTVPLGAPPRSRVTAANYDITVPGAGMWLPDDGVPGDEGPRDAFERGGASWYGFQFHQRKTASGERFDMTAMTAAHKTLPFGTRVCVRSLVNGREVLVRINDRGPYAVGRIIDLSRAAADSIHMVGLGIKQVSLSRVDAGGRCGDAINDEGDVPALAAIPEKRVVRPGKQGRPNAVLPARATRKK